MLHKRALLCSFLPSFRFLIDIPPPVGNFGTRLFLIRPLALVGKPFAQIPGGRVVYRFLHSCEQHTMKRILRVGLGLILLIALWAPCLQAEAVKAPLPLGMADILAWKNIRGPRLSPDGQWLAYWLVPNEGDGELVLRKTLGDK